MVPANLKNYYLTSTRIDIDRYIFTLTRGCSICGRIDAIGTDAAGLLGGGGRGGGVEGGGGGLGFGAGLGAAGSGAADLGGSGDFCGSGAPALFFASPKKNYYYS